MLPVWGAFLLCVEYVLVHSFEGFLHSAQRQGQVQPHVASAVEGAAVLDCHAHIPAGLEHIGNILAVGGVFVALFLRAVSTHMVQSGIIQFVF